MLTYIIGAVVVGFVVLCVVVPGAGRGVGVRGGYCKQGVGRKSRATKTWR